MRLGSLFSGVGGFDLAARWMGWSTIWYSEVDPYCCAVMAKHFPEAKSLGDIRRIDWSTVERPDILCGGFPCQDISNAGKRAGIQGERSGLWSEFARAIGDLRPRYVVVENVAALLGRGLERVLGDLAALGYDADWTVLSAADVGAPHLRERLWVVAHAASGPGGENGANVSRCGQRSLPQEASGWRTRGFGGGSGPAADVAYPNTERRDGRAGQQRTGWRAQLANRSQDVAHSNRHQCEGRERVPGVGGQDHADTERGSGRGQSASGCPDADWWTTEPDVGRVAHGVPARVDRLTGLGNAIVPQCALEIFKAIAESEGVA